METKQEQRLHARNLYFGTNRSQQEIADECNINRKTLYLWMNEGGWRHAKYAAAHAPTLLIDQYYAQLGKLNQNIAARENPWPTKDEANIMRRIMLCITQFKNHGGVTQTMNVFHDFIEYLRVKENNLAMAQEYIKPMDRYLKKIADDTTWLNYNTQSDEETHFRLEHEQWLKTQPPVEEQQPQNDVIVSPPNDIVGQSKEQPPAPVKEQQNNVIVSSPNDDPNSHNVILSSPNDDPNSNNVILSSPKNQIPNPPAPPTGQVGDRQGSNKKPQTFWEMRQQQESARLGTNPPVKAQPYNPNNTAPAMPNNNPNSDNVILGSPKNQIPNSNKENDVIPSSSRGPRAISYTPGTQPKGAPVPHPTQPRHLTTLDIQKMMETPQVGQQPNNFNPIRY